jgi:two-component system sensor histidine kinase TctE
MLWRVTLPLALTWLLGSALAMSVAYVYTRKAFDRSLLDDAYAIAANVSASDGELVFNLSPREVGAVLFDQSEREYFAILRPDGTLLAGQGGLRVAPLDVGEPYVFEERHYRGADLRMVTLSRTQPLPHTVVVAETTRSRSRLATQLLAASVAPQVALLLLLGLWLRRSIARELLPLAQLQQALEARGSTDLEPVRLAPRSRDIARLAEACNALMARIATGLRAQREFSGNVAHELRTPLAGIRSQAEYGLAQKEPAAWAAQLRGIVASEQRASHLVDQLLALALADEAHQSLQLEPVALDAVIADLLLRLMPRADALGVDLGAAGLDAPLPVMATPALIEGLVGNLIDNALRYGRPAEADVQPRVTVALQAAADEVLLTVTDNGSGMDAGQRERVLARWEQGQAGVRQRSGVGLGLAIVSRYVELLGGRLALLPVAGGPGLCACVWLQRAA